MQALLLALLAGCSFRISSNPPSDGDPDADPGADPDAPTESLIDADPCSAVEVVSTYAHTCARRADGYVWCWGENGEGQVGAPSTVCPSYPMKCNPTPVHVEVPAAIKLMSGLRHTCAITVAANGTETYCWGQNSSGELGDGGTTGALVPRKISNRIGAIALGAGTKHTCSISSSGIGECSGQNGGGEVGDGTVVRRLAPTPASLPGPASAIGAGYDHSCAVVSGAVYCWGQNQRNQAGPGGGTPILTPQVIAGIATAVAVVGGDSHSCALLADHSAKCWGDGGYGQVGNGTYLTNSPPVTVSLANIAELSADEHHTCARTLAGGVYCWGYTAYGTSTPSVALPRLQPYPRPAISISSGDVYDCAVLDDGTVWCGGINDQGQLGIGTVAATNMLVIAPTQVKLCP